MRFDQNFIQATIKAYIITFIYRRVWFSGCCFDDFFFGGGGVIGFCCWVVVVVLLFYCLFVFVVCFFLFVFWGVRFFNI